MTSTTTRRLLSGLAATALAAGLLFGAGSPMAAAARGTLSFDNTSETSDLGEEGFCTYDVTFRNFDPGTIEVKFEDTNPTSGSVRFYDAATLDAGTIAQLTTDSVTIPDPSEDVTKSYVLAYTGTETGGGSHIFHVKLTAGGKTKTFWVNSWCPAPTATTVASSLNPSYVGENVTFTGTVVDEPDALGTIEFYDGATKIGECTIVSGGTCDSDPIASLVAGTHSITAKYLGNNQYAASTSSALSQVVNKRPTTTTVVADPTSAAFGSSVKLTGTVAAAAIEAAAGPAISGQIEFFDGDTSLGTCTLAADALSCDLTTTTLSAGTHSITAKYLGDAAYLTSTSQAATVTVTGVSAKTGAENSPLPIGLVGLLTAGAAAAVLRKGRRQS